MGSKARGFTNRVPVYFTDEQRKRVQQVSNKKGIQMGSMIRELTIEYVLTYVREHPELFEKEES